MVDHSRRNLILARGDRPLPLRPPWVAEAVLLSQCARCGDCAAGCPAGVISIGAGGYPELRLEKGECTFCGRCAEACRSGVFDTGRPAFTHTASIGGGCLPAAGVECRACEDACPQSAIRFKPRLGGPALPFLDDDSCTGCGACLSHCPADAIRVAACREEPVDA